MLVVVGERRYLSELRMGDAVAIVHRNGERRVGVVGRCKVERRPFLLVTWRDTLKANGRTL